MRRVCGGLGGSKVYFNFLFILFPTIREKTHVNIYYHILIIKYFNFSFICVCGGLGAGRLVYFAIF